MPRDITVTFADGTTHVYKNAPDEVTPEQVTARASQEFGKGVKSLDGGRTPSMLESAVDKAKSWGSDLLRGALNLPTALADAQRNSPEEQQAQMAVAAASPKTGQQLTDARLPTDAAQATLRQALPRDPNANPYRTAILEGIGGQVTLPVGGLGASGLAGAAGGGFGSELAAQTMGDNFLTRFLGGMVGGGVANFAAKKAVTPRVQESSVAKEALEGVTEQQLKAASEMQAQAAKMGVKLDLSQALTATGASPTNLKTIRDLIANTKEGNKTQTLLRNQPSQVNEATRFSVDSIPGRDYGIDQAANNVQEAATKRIGQATKARTDAVRADYAAAGQLPEAAQRTVIAELEAVLKTPGLSEEARGVAGELLAKFKNAPQSVDSAAAARQAIAAAQKPSQKAAAQASLANANAAQTATRPLHSLDADVALSDTVGSYKGTPTYLANPKATGQIKGIAGKVNDILKEGSPEIAAAERKFAAISEADVNPLKQGPVGQFATPRGYTPDRAASSSKLNSFFDAGVSPTSSNSPIRVLGKELGKVDPEAFQDGFKSWVVSKLDKHSAADLTAGQAQPDALAKGVYEELFRSPKRLQGVKDAVATIAEQNGQNPVEAVRGLENLAKLVKGAADRPYSVQGVSPEQLREMAGHSLSANSLRVFGFLPFERVARWREGAQAATTFKTFDELLTSPEGAATLARLGKTSPMSPAFGALLQGFETGALQADLARDRNAPAITPR